MNTVPTGSGSGSGSGSATLLVLVAAIFLPCVKESTKQSYISRSKGGHPQFKSALQQLRNIADNQIDCGVTDLKKLRGELQLRTFKI